MTVVLQIDMPETAFSAIRKSPSEFVAEMRLAAAVKWYEMGRGVGPGELKVKDMLGIRAKGRAVIEGTQGYQLREEAARYKALFEAKNEV